jgi:hypothetical protein
MKRQSKLPRVEEKSSPAMADGEAILQVKVWLAGISPMSGIGPPTGRNGRSALCRAGPKALDQTTPTRPRQSRRRVRHQPRRSRPQPSGGSRCRLGAARARARRRRIVPKRTSGGHLRPASAPASRRCANAARRTIASISTNVHRKSILIARRYSYQFGQEFHLPNDTDPQMAMLPAPQTCGGSHQSANSCDNAPRWRELAL